MPEWLIWVWLVAALPVVFALGWLGRGVIDRDDLQAKRDDLVKHGYRLGWDARGRDIEREQQIAPSPLLRPATPPEPKRPTVGDRATDRRETGTVAMRREVRKQPLPPLAIETTPTAVLPVVDGTETTQLHLPFEWQADLSRSAK